MARRAIQKPEPASAQVYRRLSREIIDGALSPGHKLVESKLAESFGVSRIPVREAIQKLVSDGLAHAGGRSVEVSGVSMEEVDSLYGLRAALEPGITENALWARLHETNIRLGGEWIETRLLSSGPRTNPWFRECSMRAIETGDLVSFDTDLIGPYGYCADISRAWICGAKPDDEQRRLYAAAHAQVQHNIAMLKPGMSFREVSEAAWPIPEEFLSHRYGTLIHGVGLADEYPGIKHWPDFPSKGYDGMIAPGMTLCVESFIGVEGGREGVKLEEQVLITEDGVEMLSSYPMEEDWL